MNTDPVDFLLRAAMRLPRPLIERLAEELIERLDTRDGDPDVEMNGDESDFTGAEDEGRDYAGLPGIWSGPGCPIADFDVGVDDEGERADAEGRIFPFGKYGADQRIALHCHQSFHVDEGRAVRP